MSGQFTPGPWAVHPLCARIVPADHVSRPIGGSDDVELDLRDFAQEICLLHWPEPHRPECEVRANADLISAAPDLYEALAEIIATPAGDLPKISTFLKAAGALAKARGEQP